MVCSCTGPFFLTFGDILKTATILGKKLGQYCVSMKTLSKRANKDDLTTRSRSLRQHQSMKHTELSRKFDGRLR